MLSMFFGGALRNEFHNIFSLISSKFTTQLNPKLHPLYFSPNTLPVPAAHDGNNDFGRAGRDTSYAARLKESPLYGKNHVLSEVAAALGQFDSVTDDRGGLEAQRYFDPESWGSTGKSPKRRGGITPTTQVGEKVTEALRQENSYKLVRWLCIAASKDPGYIESFRKTTLTEIIHLLDPQRFLDPLKTIYKGMNRWDWMARRQQTSHAGCTLKNHMSRIRVVTKLISGRRTLRLQDYKMLLNMARSAGDGTAAIDLWEEMLKQGVQADTVCYNYYFEARCWPNPFDLKGCEMLRITSIRVRKKSFQRLCKGSRAGYRRSLKQEVNKMFTNMVTQGIEADTTTFTHLMTAHAREGDLKTVKEILNNVWRVDVDLIMETEDNSKQPLDPHPDSPLYPTADLVFTLAHIFGSNNSLAIAMRLVDHFSQRFSLKIDTRTWQELLEWAYILSLKRSKPAKSRGFGVGWVPSWSVEWLWDVMISDSGFDKPTMHMLNLIIRNFRNRKMLSQMLSKMIEGLEFYNALLDRHALRFQPLQSQQEESKALAHPPYEVLFARLEENRDFHMIYRWFRWLLSREYYDQGDPFGRIDWERQRIPEAIETFWSFRPVDVLSYHIITGSVQLYWEKKIIDLHWEARKFRRNRLRALSRRLWRSQRNENNLKLQYEQLNSRIHI